MASLCNNPFRGEGKEMIDYGGDGGGFEGVCSV